MSSSERAGNGKDANPELEALITRTRSLFVQTLADAAKPPAQEAVRFLSGKLVGLGLGVVLLLAAVLLMLGGAVLLISQWVPLWATCLGSGVVALLVGAVILNQTNKG